MSEVRNYQYHFIWKLILQCYGVNNVVYDYIKSHIILNIFHIYISQYTVTLWNEIVKQAKTNRGLQRRLKKKRRIYSHKQHYK